RRWWIRVENCLEDEARGFAMKWQRSRCHLVQHCTEGKQVSAPVQFLAPDLLRRHVFDRAERRARAGQMLVGNCAGLRVRSCDLAGRGHRSRYLRQPEIENLGMTPLGNEDVRWLDVPMNNTLCVRGVQSVRNLDS